MKITRIVLVLAAVLGIAALTGCGLFPGKVVVKNSSTYTVIEVDISQIDETTWGSNWLTSSLAPGASVELEGVSADDYDLRAIESGGGGWLIGNIVDGEPVVIRGLRTYTWTLTNATHLSP